MPELAPALTRLGTVGRFANPSLWDALATAIVRQVIRADQARLLYQRFSDTHGEHVSHAGSATYVFPSPETVLGLFGEATIDEIRTHLTDLSRHQFDRSRTLA